MFGRKIKYKVLRETDLFELKNDYTSTPSFNFVLDVSTFSRDISSYVMFIVIVIRN